MDLEIIANFTNAIPTDMILSIMSDYIEEYTQEPSDENFGKIVSCCTMIIQKRAIKDIGGVDKFMDRYKEFEDAHKLFKNFTNPQ